MKSFLTESLDEKGSVVRVIAVAEEIRNVETRLVGNGELPNTGTADSTVAMVAAAASALLGLGLAGRRRKEDEEA